LLQCGFGDRVKVLPAFLLLAACPLPAVAQTANVEVRVLPREVIQRRLESVSRKLEERRATLQSLFEEVGCRDERLSSQKVPGSKAGNLICTLPGDPPDAGVIVVGGHFDLIAAGMGAVDDWSGVVLLPSLYQGLTARPRRHTFVFIGFAAEERGLVGSTEYVHKLSKAEKANIRAMVNLECLGTTPPKVWASRADKLLLGAYTTVARSLNLDVVGSNVERLGDDDSHPFLNARIRVITIHSITPETFLLLHSPRDQLSAIRPGDYYDAYRLIATCVAYFDTLLN
jgi:hypothetical protein